jgi:hypothetical protein
MNVDLPNVTITTRPTQNKNDFFSRLSWLDCQFRRSTAATVLEAQQRKFLNLKQVRAATGDSTLQKLGHMEDIEILLGKGVGTMAVSHLTTVSDADDAPASGAVVELGRGAEAAAWRIQQLQHEARSMAREQVEAFARDLNTMGVRAAAIAGGGEAYAVGARELASRLAAELPQKAQLLLTLLSREK